MSFINKSTDVRVFGRLRKQPTFGDATTSAEIVQFRVRYDHRIKEVKKHFLPA